MERGDIVRSSLMRLTIHLATAADFRWLRPTLEPMLEQKARGRARLPGADLRVLEQAARRRLAAGPATMVDLRALFDPSLDRDALADFLHARIPFVHVPPSGTWQFGGRSQHAHASDLDEPDLERLVVRYLQAFGPATVRDIQAWSGLTRLRASVEALGDRLLELRGDDGATYYDLPEAPRPPAETPAPVRFLPVWDNLLLAHADRRRVIPDGRRPVDVIGKPTYLVEGWSPARGAGRASASSSSRTGRSTSGSRTRQGASPVGCVTRRRRPADRPEVRCPAELERN